MDAPMPPRNQSYSLRRALELLESIRQAMSPRSPGASAGSLGASAAELAEHSGLSRSSVFRLLQPLLAADLVTRSDTGRYTLGPGVLALGQAYLDGLDLRTVAAPHLSTLQSATGETCHLVVPEGTEVLYVDKVQSIAVIRMASRVGRRMPAYCTGVGKAMLAFGPPEWLQACVAAGMPALTDHTLTTAEDLATDLDHIRRRGYAIDDRENEPAVRCVAAAILDRGGLPIGAVSLSALAHRMPPARVRELGVAVRHSAAAICADMSALPSTRGPGIG